MSYLEEGKQGSGPTLEGPGVSATSTASWDTVAEDAAAQIAEAKGVSLGKEYRVCADKGEVVSVGEPSLGAESSGPTSSLSSSAGLKKMGSSFTPTLVHAFSSRTGEALRMSRGKSYEGEDFTLSWTITLQVPDRASKAKKGAPRKMKTILDGVVGQAQKGQLVAVMGSSGCGKTSFLDCLSMRNQAFKGNIFVNGKEVDGRFFSLAGFVHQDDIFIPTETVREHLTFHAMLRCDACIRPEARLRRVDRLLKAVNLEHVAGSMLGGPGSFIRGLSGGERRRVSFATELLSDPVIIFADEFTTGLDAAMAKAVCRSLRNIAHSGRLVIGTIHQPSSDVFNVFTHVMLMSQGRLIYLGPRKQLGNYFEALNDPRLVCPGHHNPADFYVQLIALNPELQEESQARIDFLADAWQGSAECKAVSEWQEEIPYPDLLEVHRTFKMRHFQATSWTQFVFTFKRNLQAIYRDPMNFGATLFTAVFSGLLLGLSYRGPPAQPATGETVRNMTGLFFLLSLMQMLISLYAAVMAFAAETKVFMRENQAGVNRVGAYFWAKQASNYANEIAVPFIYGLLIWWLAGLRRGIAPFFIFQALNILNGMCASSIGYCLAAITADDKIALALIPPILFPSTIFSGTLYDLNTAHGVRKFLAYISLIRYAVGGMTVNEFQPDPNRYRADPAIPNPEAAWHKVTAYPLADNVWALAGFAVVIRLVAYLLLHRRTAKERVKVL